jgi:hypothetical protein
MRLYYKIWVDCILRLKSIDTNKTDWKYKSMAIMSLAMGFNFILIMVLLQKNVFGYFYEINFQILTGFQNYVLTMLILYFLPCILINYLLIFRGDRYLKLIDKYPYRNGKLSFTYFLISIFLPIILIWGGIILSKLSVI